MSNEVQVGTLKTAAVGVTVERAGQVTTLSQGDAVMWGDKIMNNSRQAVEIDLKAQSPGHGDGLLVMAPNSAAALAPVDSPVADAAMRTEVSALTPGVELYEVSDAVNTAVLVQEGGDFSGLVGAGLLAGGAGAGATAGLVGVGVLGAAMLADSNSDDTNALNPDGMLPTEAPTQAPTDAPTEMPTEGPTEGGSDAPTDAPTDTPTEAPPVDVSGTELTGLAGLIADAADTLDASLGDVPVLGMVVDGLTDLLGSGEGNLIPLPGGLADAVAFVGDAIKDGLADVPVLSNLASLVGGVLGGVSTITLGDFVQNPSPTSSFTEVFPAEPTEALGNLVSGVLEPVSELTDQTGQTGPMDSTPQSGQMADLSTAADLINPSLFASIVEQISAIDLSLFGMNQQFNPEQMSLSPQVGDHQFADLGGFSPMASSAGSFEPIFTASDLA